MKQKRNILILRIIGLLTVLIYPIIISVAQIFSVFEFKGIPFDINNFSIFQDTYIFVNIPVLILILIVTSKFKQQTSGS